VDWAARAAWAGVSTGREGARERAWGEKRAGPRGLLGQEGKGWVGLSAGKREGVGLGPGVRAVGLVTGPRCFGVWAPFLIPFLFYFFSFLNLILIQTQGK